MPSPSPPPSPSSPSRLPEPDPTPWKSYIYTPTERHIFAPSPYKSLLLPHWRFSTPEKARTSAAKIYEYFLLFEDKGDFVGADNARKFLQMGMTRAARYANHKGGRKYAKGSGTAGTRKVKKGGREQVQDNKDEDEQDWEGRAEKREASKIFREVWEKAKGSEGYLLMKAEHVKRTKEWDKEQRAVDGR